MAKASKGISRLHAFLDLPDAFYPKADRCFDALRISVAHALQESLGFLRHLMIFPSSPRKMTWDVFGATLIVPRRGSKEKKTHHGYVVSSDLVIYWICESVQ